jgi:hypothetical protein
MIKWALLAIPTLCFGYTIKSNELTYMGENIEINGACELTHSKIKIFSERGSLERLDNLKELKKATLNDHVLIKFPNHGLIQCDSVSLDFENRIGILKKEQGQIFYQSDFFIQSIPHPLSCRCNLASFEFNDTKSKDFKLKMLTLEGNLETTLKNSYVIKGEKALITFDEKSQDFIPLELEMTNRMKPIELSLPDASFFTQLLKINFEEEKITFKTLQGKSDWKGKIDFEIAEGHYHFSDKLLTIDNFFLMTHEKLGRLQSKGMIIEKINYENWKNFQNLTIKAPFDVTYLNHHLKSSSNMYLDQPSRLLSVDTKNEKLPIVYRYEDVELLADSLVAKLDDDFNQFSKIQFLGNIKLRLKDPIYQMQYLLADEIIFFPNENKIEVISYKDRKIIFWTDEEKTALSCEKITLNYDKINKKRSAFFKGQIEAVIDKPEFFP